MHPHLAFGAPPQQQPWKRHERQLSPLLTGLFGVVSLIPLAGVVATSVYFSSLADLRSGPLSLERLVVPLLVVVAIAFVQIALGALVAAVSSKRSDLSGTEKLVWSLGSLFVGSIMLPMFWLCVLRKPLSPSR